MPAVPTRPARSLLTLLLLPVLTGLFVVAGATSAQAADGYKYWNYFHVTGAKYTFAKSGPADYVPKPGSIEAYRYGVTSSADGLQPRTDPTTYTLDDLCAGTTLKPGQKRVGVLLDFGTAADAAGGETPPKPRGACAVLPKNATGQQVLDDVADVRMQKSFLCGIDGYPVKTCSVTVKNAPAASPGQNVEFAMPAKAQKASSSTKPVKSDAERQGGGISWPLIGVIVVVVLLGAGAFALTRRNRSS